MENDFTTRLNTVLTQIKDMKMNQIVGGDSWVVYRSKVDITTNDSQEYLIRFIPEMSGDFVAVCKETSQDRTVPGGTSRIVPDPNIKGRWWRPFQSNFNLDVASTFFVYSTVKGKVVVENVTGQNAGAI